MDTTFEFVTPLETITDMTNSFDSATNSEVFTVTGTEFPSGDISAVSLYIDDIVQETLTVTTTVATFKVINVAT